MKQMKITVILLTLTVGLLFHRHAVAQNLGPLSVIGGGGGVVQSNTQRLVGTFGQPVIGVMRTATTKHSIGFSYLSRKSEPVLSITEPTANQVFPSGTTSTALKVSIDNHTGGWHWKLNDPFPASGLAGGARVASGNTTSITGLQDGRSYTVHVVLVDDKQNVLSPSVTASVTFAVGSLTLSISKPTTNQAFGISENQQFTIDVEATGGAPPLIYSATNLPTGASFDPSTRKFLWRPTFVQGADPARSYSLTFTVTDNDNATAEVTATIQVADVNRPPEWTLPPTDQTVDENKQLMFTVKATDPDGDTLTYSASSLPSGATFDPATQTFSWTPAFNQGGGSSLSESQPYQVTFTVTDAPKDGKTETAITITVNNVNRPPQLDAIGDKTVQAGGLLTFTVSATDDDGDALTYSALDRPSGATFNPTTRQFSWTPTQDQGDKTYTVTFKATDRGGLSDTQTVQIAVSRIKIPPQITFPTANQLFDIDENQLLTIDVETTGGTSPLTYSATNLPTGASFDPSTRKFSWRPTFAQGADPARSYPLTFTVIDSDNQTASVAATIQVKDVNRPPTWTLPPTDITVAENQQLTFAVNATDPDGDTVTYAASNRPLGADFNSTTQTFSWMPTFAQGGGSSLSTSQTYQATFTVTDAPKDGKTETSITIIVNNVNRQPKLDPINDQTVQVGDSLTFTVSATDPDGDTLTYSASDRPSGATFNPTTRQFSWTPTQDQGDKTYTVTFKATDRGELSDTQTVEISVGKPIQITDPTADQVFRIDENQPITIDVKTIGGTPLFTYSVANRPTDSSLDEGSGKFSWTPTFDQGDAPPRGYSLTFTVRDSNNQTDSVKITIQVTNVNRPPEWMPLPTDQMVSEGELLMFAVNATDPDGDKLSYSASPLPLPTGADFNGESGEFSWTPEFDQAEAYVITFTATDGDQQTAPAAITIQVTNVNRPPEWTQSPEDQTVSEGDLLIFTVNAADPDDDKLTYAASPLPSGAEFDANSGEFSWTPGFDQANSYAIAFTATDGEKQTPETSITIQVEDVDNEPPTGTVELVGAPDIGTTPYYVATQTVPLQLDAKDDKTDRSKIRVRLHNKEDNRTSEEAFAASKNWDLSTGDGEKTVEIRFIDESGNTSEPVEVTFVLDTTPPVIDHTPVTSENLRSNVSIEANVTDASPVEGRIYYRPGGDSNFSPLEMTGDKPLKGEIPSGEFGVSYYVEVEDELGHKSTSTEKGALDPIGIAVSGEFTHNSAFTHDAWQLFSVPLSDAPTPVNFLNDDVGQNEWAAGRWNRATKENQRTDSPAAQRGESFWLISKRSFELKIEGKTAPPNEPYSISLREGWNLVANPFPFAVAFGNVRVAVGVESLPLSDAKAEALVTKRFWRWEDTSSNNVTDGENKPVENFSEMWQPWAGYWMLAKSDATLEIEPFTALIQAAPAASPPPTLDWLATLSIGNARGVSRVGLALAKTAGWGYDPLDVEQPPGMASISLSLLQEGMRFQRVALPLESEEWVWEAKMEANNEATLVLLDIPPSGHHLYLERLEDGSRIELSPNQPIPVSDGRHRVRFRLTKQILGWDVLDTVPTVTQLLPNYPNPFNPETWIPFTLSKASMVEIGVYDTQGRRVRQLSLGLMPAGRYSEKGRAVYWDGRNDVGESVSSGVYFVELQTERYQQVRRIVLLK